MYRFGRHSSQVPTPDTAGGRQIIFPVDPPTHTPRPAASIVRVLIVECCGGPVARSPVGCMAMGRAGACGARCGQGDRGQKTHKRTMPKDSDRMPCSTRHQTSRESSHLRESRLAALRRRRTSLRDGTSRTRSLITPRRGHAAKSAPSDPIPDPVHRDRTPHMRTTADTRHTSQQSR